MQSIKDECILRNLSLQTTKAYIFQVEHFLLRSKLKPKQVTVNDIRDYLLLLRNNGKSPNSVNLAHSALYFYFKNVLGRKFRQIPFQKRPKTIPLAATRTEIEQMINVTNNPKHKLMISLIYASGVRVSELVTLKVKDIDFERKILAVRLGKGNKDRYTKLSDKVCNELMKYLSGRTEGYLFIGIGNKMNTQTIRLVLKKARKSAKISKRLTPHTIRRSFATDHKAIGTDERIIQSMLGHANRRTTQGYFACIPDLDDVKSPQDNTS